MNPIFPNYKKVLSLHKTRFAVISFKKFLRRKFSCFYFNVVSFNLGGFTEKESNHRRKYFFFSEKQTVFFTSNLRHNGSLKICRENFDVTETLMIFQ